MTTQSSGLSAELDHAEPFVELADGDRALLDHVVLVDDQNVRAELARTDRRVGNEQAGADARIGTRTRANMPGRSATSLFSKIPRTCRVPVEASI